MIEDRARLIEEIEAYASAAGLEPSTVCRYAGQGGGFWRRLTAGRRIYPETIEKVREYMAENPPRRAKGGD